jgi:uncharacterized protein YjbJ (UPF0337 family)
VHADECTGGKTIGCPDRAVRARNERSRAPEPPKKGCGMKMGTPTLMIVLSLSALAITATHKSSWAMPQNDDSLSTTAAHSVLVINDDQFQGKWKQFKGDLKKKWGNFTDDDLLYIEGRRDKLEGKIQERYGDRKEEVNKWVDEWFEKNKTSPNH